MTYDFPMVIEPKIFSDDRGYFFESFNENNFKELVPDITFVQDNESKSDFMVLRGLHFQKPPFAQAKLVRVIQGAVLDFVVDIRKNSPTYGVTFYEYLSGKNHKQFFVPEGFAHGFISLEKDTIFQYKCSNFYNKESEGGIHFSSALWETIKDEIKKYTGLDIDDDKLLMTEKDINWEKIDTFDSPFTYNSFEIDEQ